MTLLQRSHRIGAHIALGIALTGAVAVSASAQKPAAKPAKKPSVSAKPATGKLTAAQILDRSASASGGRALAAVSTTVMKATMTLAAQGINGTMEITTKAPDRFLMRSTIGGVGESLSGFDGKVGWSKDPINGLRTLEGAELTQAKQQASQNDAKDWKTLYSKTELLGVRKVGTQSCYAVKVTPKSGGAMTLYFDTTTFLPARVDAVVDSPNGKIPTETYMSDYRTISGVKYPFKLRQVIPPLVEVQVVFTSVEVNVPVDDAQFARPADTTTKPAKMP